ncbi:DMT family transporter [Marinobacterium weihaiense]|uniref:DMT family transporter n=1 Tax=Marinobacterium weihaiense TaxID=2851016 RepID=A0ABS6MDG4_9GAMM|nr:DMT family transporter [Marinobacterium weihaiense]MBV0934348.1 DMT family transporter [Marinobacterium weihaiense]
MSTVRRHLDLMAVSLLLMLCLGWGFQQVAIKLAADDIAPTLQIGLRSAFAATVLLLLMLRQEGLKAFADGTLKAGLLAGTMFALEFLFVGEALARTHASHVVVFLYTSPIFTALGLHFVHADERLAGLQWGGIGLAFIGVCIAFLGGGDVAGTSLTGDAMALLAGAIWGLTTVVIRGSSLSEAPAVKTLFYQMAVAAVMLIGAAFIMGNGRMHWTPDTTLNLAFQAVVIAVGSYLTWFWLLKRYLASRMATFVFMTPLVGVLFGVMILDEALSRGFVGGGLLVLAGIFLVSAKDLLNQRKARRVQEALETARDR